MAEVEWVWQKLMELSVTVGIMDAAFQSAEYESVREGWEERLEQIGDWADKQVQEVQGFGEAFDL